MPALAQARQAPAGLIHLALAVGGFAIGTTEFATMSLLPFFARDLGIDATTAGHAISAYALGVVVGAPVLAILAARFSKRMLLVALMALFAVGNGLSGLAGSYEQMLGFRFLAGLPHGAYFGIAALVAAGLVPTGERTKAVARVMLGLTAATIVGVPLANFLGQAVGWRWVFALVAALALTTALLVYILAPRDEPDPAASPLRELKALGKTQIWLTLAVGAIGFGGMFAVYTYLADTMLEVTRTSEAAIPVALAAFGIGMTGGNLIVPRFADKALLPTAAGLLIWSTIALLMWPLATGTLWTLCLGALAIGIGGALGTVLQTRLMDVAGEAQALAAALNHSAFNTANALGPWLGGIAIAAGYGWTSTGWVGALLALGGLLFLGVSMLLERQAEPVPAPC
ncbi:MFS transporter [Sphingomonas spermidinifaciens]|uniref:MFS transporter n=1 Tax=Sphingomonas spermidinifaciens TaxID=1141889 RepID=A0A2A4B9J4_9SPHN|nr:MFS transporter [Sphingomonas spermidinifaciens]PCD04595.1 MFS transporter [Sphingomonas spermidinifaciens]